MIQTLPTTQSAMDEARIITTQNSVKYTKVSLDGATKPVEEMDPSKVADELSSQVMNSQEKDFQVKNFQLKDSSTSSSESISVTEENCCSNCVGHCLYCCDCSLVCHSLLTCMTLCLVNALLCQ